MLGFILSQSKLKAGSWNEWLLTIFFFHSLACFFPASVNHSFAFIFGRALVLLHLNPYNQPLRASVNAMEATSFASLGPVSLFRSPSTHQQTPLWDFPWREGNLAMFRHSTAAAERCPTGGGSFKLNWCSDRGCGRHLLSKEARNSLVAHLQKFSWCSSKEVWGNVYNSL